LPCADENAVYVALSLAGLNDNFELDDFDSRKQGIMNALVACSPQKTAPCVLETSGRLRREHD
jgi:telomere length regulation protein